MTTLFVDQLTVIDFSYFDPNRGIVGESWILDVELTGKLDEQGMVFDFTHVKKQIKSHVDGLIDHKLVIASASNAVSVETGDGLTSLNLTRNNGMVYQHTSPEQAVCMIPVTDISPDSITPHLTESILSILPDNVTRLSITLRPEDISTDYYHYSHGLKKHFGDCQRIAHGHRSKIQVWRNGERDHHCEGTIAKDWQDIYLITEEDIAERFTRDGHDFITVTYQANQGPFSLTIDADSCDILTTDSTVELIAEYLANKLKRLYPSDSIKVRAFEGVQKGAIAAL
ncbi:MAG: 6-carboxytetrahydropterin synthase [Kangiellaceae bacterium]|jgi:6-pyruvoyl-tetrahydropterin synthase|nr:6-carboxytetrahydropterin synthase [Kangiellaceae bacterium]